MATAIAETAFIAGELAPGLYGSVDLTRWHVAASTLRNCFPAVQRGAYSRAGTAFVGFSKQAGRSYPPRLLPFQFSIAQGLVLEFGNQYMRVIYQGAFVTDVQGVITNITQADPAVMTATINALGAASAVADGGASQSYAPLDLVTLAGGVFTTPTVLQVTNTLLVDVAVNSPGVGNYAPANTIHLTGGTQTTDAVLAVAATQVVSATLAAAGAANFNGLNVIVGGTTGTGVKFQASVDVGAGTGITFINSITLGGDYTANPTTPATEPVVLVSGYPVGATLTGAELDVVLGVLTVTISNAGVFTANPAGGKFTQTSSSGSGTGATFVSAVMGPNVVAVQTAGVYTTYPANPVAQASTSGSGRGETFNVTTEAVAGGSFNNGDWLFVDGVEGMTELNGQTVVISNLSGASFNLNDVYGNPINATAFAAYTGGGMISRIYTLPTPYSEVDLPYLKITEANDVLTLCCVNQVTLTEYPTYDLSRISDSNWTLTETAFAPTVQPPSDLSGAASTSGDVDYQYVATAVSPVDGTESIASNIATISSAVDIAATAGTITLDMDPSPTPNVQLYNFYKAEPGYSVEPPVGALFGFTGQAYGVQFLDSNIVADFSQVPPTAQNPFARGQVLGANVTNSTGTVTTVSFAINTASGSGAELEGVIVGSALVAILVLENGQNYGPDDTVSITVTGGGSATATLNIGPQNGTYPGTPCYFQERRGYAYTLNQPDTYFFSQPGSYTNFGFRIPTIDSDAITGTPWASEQNGVQFMLTTAGGLLIFTGLSVWLLVGSGSFATNVQPISPSSQNVNPQPEIGCSPTVQPVKIDYDVLYVSSKNAIYFDLPYQLYALSWPLDITVSSSHLFTNYSIVQHAWCREPWKLLWAVRSDGILLSLTWLKPEQVQGWARHDTNGTFESVCSITEPPVDALYLATQRQIGANEPYIIERMDNRLWTAAETCWCVDCGFALPQPQPQATLSASSATGLGACTGVTGVPTNSGWSGATTAIVVDAPMGGFGPIGPGAGAVPTLTIVGGVITAITFAGGSQGSGYLNPQLVFKDPAGSQGGSFAVATAINDIIILSNTMEFTASAAVFSAGNVGSVIRMGGGIAEITAYIDTEHVTANILSPIIDTVPNSGGQVQPQPAGAWTMTAPVGTVYVPQLVGATVTGLADGNVIPSQVVGANGLVTLSEPASAVTVGFGFTAQVQSVYLDAGEPTVQGQRKTVANVVARLQASRGVQIGSNQIDGSTLSPIQVAPPWSNLEAVPDMGIQPYNAPCAPLWTGDSQHVPVTGGFQKPGQVALQQSKPLPLEVLALFPSLLSGDVPEQKASPRQNQRGRVAA